MAYILFIMVLLWTPVRQAKRWKNQEEVSSDSQMQKLRKKVSVVVVMTEPLTVHQILILVSKWEPIQKKRWGYGSGNKNGRMGLSSNGKKPHPDPDSSAITQKI